MKEKPWIDQWMSWTLNLGTLLSILLVFSGGAIYLFNAGNESIQLLLQQSTTYPLNFSIIAETIQLTPAVGLIEMGLFCLIATQLLRVGMLLIYYIYTKDYWFILINLFVLLVLVYSFIWKDIH